MSFRTSRCPFPQKEQDRLPWWWLSFRLMSPPVEASLRARREARQPQIGTHVGPLSECIDVPSVTPETDRPRRRLNGALADLRRRLAHAPRPAQRWSEHAANGAAQCARAAAHTAAHLARGDLDGATHLR